MSDRRDSHGDMSHRERPRSRLSGTPPPLPLSGKATPNGRVPPLESSRPISTILSQTPDTVVGEFVKIEGDLAFKNLLRVDGYFKGKLKSSGSLIVGAKGFVEGDVLDMNEVVCDGVIIGDIRVKRAVLRSHAIIKGNLTARKLNVGEKVSIHGNVMVHRKHPEPFIGTEDLKKSLRERFGGGPEEQKEPSAAAEQKGDSKQGDKAPEEGTATKQEASGGKEDEGKQEETAGKSAEGEKPAAEEEKPVAEDEKPAAEGGKTAAEDKAAESKPEESKPDGE